MAQIVINVPDARLPDVLNYVARSRTFTGLNPAGDPETKQQFVRRQIIEQIQIWVAQGRRIEADEQINDGTFRDTMGIT